MPRTTAPVAVVDESLSQVVKAQLQLREMILAGELPGVYSPQLGPKMAPVVDALQPLGSAHPIAGGRMASTLTSGW